MTQFFTETLIHNIDAFLSNDVLHTDDLNQVVQIAKDLKKRIIDSQINTADELKNEPVDKVELEQATLAQELQQALSSIQVQLLENVLQISVSLSYEGVANVISQLSNNLAIAMSSLTKPQKVKLDSKELRQTHAVIEDFGDDYEIKIIEKEQVSPNQDGKQIEIFKDQMLLEATDEFVDCSSEPSDSYKGTAYLLSQKDCLLSETPETALTEITKPFEEFFDSPTSADQLASAELIANEIGEITIFEHTQNIQKDGKAAESFILSVSGNLAPATTDEVNVIENTDFSKIEYFTVDTISDGDEVENPLLTFAVGGKVKVKEVTQQEKATQEVTYNSCKNENPENVTAETTRPFEKKLESVTLEAKLPTAEPIATAINVVTILEHTKCFENNDEATGSTILGLSDSFASAVINEVYVMETTEIRKDKRSTTEVVAYIPEVETPLFEVAIRGKVNIEDTTTGIACPKTLKEFVVLPKSAKAAGKFPSTELNAIEIAEITNLADITNFEKEHKSTRSATLSGSDSLATAVINKVKGPEAIGIGKSIFTTDEVATSPDIAKSLLEVAIGSEVNFEDATLQQENVTQSVAILCDQQVPLFVQDTIIVDSESAIQSQNESLALEILENNDAETTKSFKENLDLPTFTEIISVVKLAATEITETTILENTENFEKQWKDSKSAIVGVCDSLTPGKVNVVKATEIKKDKGSTTEVNAKELTTQENITHEIVAVCHDAETVFAQDTVIIDNEPATTVLQRNKELSPVKIGTEMLFYTNLSLSYLKKEFC